MYPPAVPFVPQVGSLVGPYQLEKVLGSGGFGSVFAARDRRSNKEVALKLLNSELVSDAELVERFRREAEVTVRAGNPHIVRVLDASLSSECAYVALELLRGESLSQVVKRGPMLAARAVDIVVQVLDGLALAHAQGVIHRDIKPANIFLVDEPGSDAPLAKILDFGIGRMLQAAPDSRLTRTGASLGTPYFMAPEQVADTKRADVRADLYSVAVTLYLMISGEAPYGRITPGEWLQKIARREMALPLTSSLEVLPPALVEAVAMALSMDPNDRFNNAGAFARALVETMPHSATSARELPALRENPSFLGQSPLVPRDSAPVEDAVSPPATRSVPPGPTSQPPPAPALAPVAPSQTRRALGMGVVVGALAVLIVIALLFGAYAVFGSSSSREPLVTEIPAPPSVNVAPVDTRTPLVEPQLFCAAPGDDGKVNCEPYDATRGSCPNGGKPAPTCVVGANVAPEAPPPRPRRAPTPRSEPVTTPSVDDNVSDRFGTE